MVRGSIVLFLLILHQFSAVGQLGSNCDDLVNSITSVQSIDARLKDFSDLEFLQSLLREKRVVLLGEATHGDGSSIRAKIRVAKFLKERCGFKVLLLERNIFEIHRIMNLIEGGLDKRILLKEALRLGTDISAAEEGISEFLIDESDSFSMGGIDVLYFGWGVELFLQDMEDLIEKARGKPASRKVLRAYGESLKSMMSIEHYESDGSSHILPFRLLDFEKLTEELKQVVILSATRDKGMLYQTLENNLGLAQWIEGRPRLTSTNFDDYSQLRDKQMAANLRYHLAATDQKVIVFTSTYHMTRGIGKYPTMHDYLIESQPSLKDVIYSIPFAAYSGKRGVLFSDTDVGEPIPMQKETLEDDFGNTSLKYGFLDCNNVRSCLNQTKFASSGFFPNSGKWGDAYDGIFFIREMEPNRFVGIKLADWDYLEKMVYSRKRR